MKHFLDIFKQYNKIATYIDYKNGNNKALYKQFYEHFQVIVAEVNDERYTNYFANKSEKITIYGDELATVLQRILLILPLPEENYTIEPTSETDLSFKEKLDTAINSSMSIIKECNKHLTQL